MITPHDVFISYSRKDKDFVRHLDEALRARGRETWVDWDDIRPAEEFMQAIFAAIESADTFVFVLTPDSVGSKVCEREVAHAVALNKRLIPIVAREIDAERVPGPLAALNWIFCRESDDLPEAVERLISALDTDLEWVRAHTRVLTRALEWQAKGKSNSYALRGEDLTAAEQWLAQAGATKERQPTILQTEYVIAGRKATSRRQRIVLGGVSFGFAVALGLAVVAFISRQRAVEQEKRAVAGRERADGVIRFIQNDLPEKLRPVGRLDLMSNVALAVDKYYQAMQQAEGESVDTLAGNGWVLLNHGGIDQQQSRLDQALEKYRAAVLVGDKALRLNPESNKALEYSASAHGILGMALQLTGQPDAGVEEIRKYREAYETLTERDPTNPQWQRQLATSCTAEAVLLVREGKFDTALTKFSQGRAIHEKLVAQAPKDSASIFDLASSENYVAGMLLQLRQFEPALTSFRSAQEKFRQLNLGDPRNVDWQRALALSHKNIAAAVEAMGDTDSALQEYEKHAEAMDEIAAADRTNSEWQRQAAEGRLLIGNLHLRHNRFTAALGEYRRYYSSIIQLAERDRSNVLLQSIAALFCAQIAQLNVALGTEGNLQEAAEAVQKGLTVLRILEEKGPLSAQSLKAREELEKIERSVSAASSARRGRAKE